VSSEVTKADEDKHFRAMSGKHLDALAWFWFEATRLPGESDESFRARCKSRVPFRAEPLTLETATGRDLDAFCGTWFDLERLPAETDEAYRQRCRDLHAKNFPPVKAS